MPTKPSAEAESVPNAFVQKHHADVIGVLHGFDRLRLSGTFRALYHPPVMEKYISKAGFLLKDFKQLMLRTTGQIKTAAQQMAERTGRPLTYLSSSQVRKEEVARHIAQKDGVTSGLIAILSCVEPCRTYTVGGNPQTKKLEAHLGLGKCLHYYFYHFHPVFGFMHLRLQSWFPFLINICLNGRHWLAQRMTGLGMRYEQQDNCFTWIEDVAQAQRLLDEQLNTRWAVELEKLVLENHPTYPAICRPIALSYYWTACESEYATDVMFAREQRLAQLYPQLVHHGIKSYGSRDVLRFLGHKPPAHGVGKFAGELHSSLKHRPEGLRIKHFVNGNSVKLYDKQGSVLRVETTINHPEEFKVWRARENDPEQKKAWCELRRGVADLPRRAQVSQAANERYLTALAVVDEKTPLSQEAQTICQRLRKDGQSYRALNPWSVEDARLLEAVNRGEFAINGFRNRDLRALLFSTKGTAQEQKRRAGAITRKIRLLRAHGLIRKVSGTHRYVVSEKGRRIITALLTARQANVEQLTALAA
jgi:hypothetical protein